MPRLRGARRVDQRAFGLEKRARAAGDRSRRPRQRRDRHKQAANTKFQEGEETMATNTAQGSTAKTGGTGAASYKDLMKEQFKVDATWLSGFAVAIVVATLVMAASGVPAGWVAAIAVFLSALVLMGAMNHKLSQLIVAVQSQR
jgi:predicted RND superfamily exporter protein